MCAFEVHQILNSSLHSAKHILWSCAHPNAITAPKACDTTQGIGAAHGVKTSLSFNTEFIETINALEPTQAVVDAARAMGLKADGSREPMSFSEDFAHFSEAVPGCFLLMGNGQEGPWGQPLHSDDYDFNDDLLPIGAAFWAQLVRDRLPKT